jgi:RimJ/RimL family protein N-acetyltransferase
MNPMLSIRPLQHSDIPLFLKYWFESDEAFLRGMGLDVSKLPTKEQFTGMLEQLLVTPIEQRTSYAVVWLKNEQPIGHSNTNPTTFGEEAKMHLHIWDAAERQKGMGTELVKLSVAHYFEVLQLKTIWCEPYALNPAPNKTLEKAGFEFVKAHVTIPGVFNFEQPVKQWRMTRGRFDALINNSPI